MRRARHPSGSCLTTRPPSKDHPGQAHLDASPSTDLSGRAHIPGPPDSARLQDRHPQRILLKSLDVIFMLDSHHMHILLESFDMIIKDTLQRRRSELWGPSFL